MFRRDGVTRVTRVLWWRVANREIVWHRRRISGSNTAAVAVGGARAAKGWRQHHRRVEGLSGDDALAKF